MDYTKECSIVFFVLNNLDNGSKQKIPKELYDFFDAKRDKNYKVEIDLEIPIYEQELDTGIVEILAEIYQKYLCSSEEKIEFIKQKYNMYNKAGNNEYYNIFKNKKCNSDMNNYSEEIKCKDLILNRKKSFLKRIIYKIKSLLK